MEWFKHIRQQEPLTRRLRRLPALAVAGILTVAGAALTLTPLPFGAPVLAGGLALLSAVDRTCWRAIMRAREKSKLLNSVIAKTSAVLPERFRKIIGLTDPLTYQAEPGSADQEKE